MFSKGTDPKAQAMGYSHSYLDSENACVESLASYPTDGEIALTVGEAWDEAVALLGLLGIEAEDISKKPDSSSTELSSASPDPDEADLVDEENSDGKTESIDLQHLISIQQTSGWEAVDSETKDKMHMLTCAVIALDIEERRNL